MGKAFSAALSIVLLVLANWAGAHWKRAAALPDGKGQAAHTTSLNEAPVCATQDNERTNRTDEALRH